MKKILVLSANPVDTSRLRLDEEVREIQEALKRSNSRDEFEIVSLVALRVAGLRRGLLDHSPSIVHFSGHGESQGLILENDVGQKQLVDKEALAQLFSFFPSIECVLLNACYSEAQAEEIYQHVNCVIGMSQTIGDRAAINFAVGFYDALGAGRSYQECFDMARNAIRLAGIPESATPRIKIMDDSGQSIDLVDQDLFCPYKGLSTFRIEDAKFFYGRDVFIEELLVATKTRNFIPILGDSGSGKSSVVFAGLVPRLQETDRCIVIEFRPSEEPFDSLAWELMPHYTSSTGHKLSLEFRGLIDDLRNGKVLLADVFRQIQKNHPQDQVLLIADQFEEIYTLCGDELVRRKFLDVLLAGLKSSATWQAPPILVVTMRIDFYSNVLSYPPFADAFRNSDIKIRSMNRDELKDVIEKPANQMGVNFESGLVDRILDEVESQTSNLPLIEFALTELWKRQTGRLLTHEAYQAITYSAEQNENGGFERALASYADDVYQKFSWDDQVQIRRIFAQLVHPGEGKEDIKRVAIQRELGEISWDLVTKLANSRLVVTSQNADGQNTVEIVHEALIQHWGSLRQWIEADRDFLVYLEDLRNAQRRWIRSNRKRNSLLSGTLLEESRKYLIERGQDLQPEKDFIERSFKAKKSDLSFVLFSLAGFVIVVFLFYLVIWISGRKTELGKANSLGHYSLELITHQKFDSLINVIKAGVILQKQGAEDKTVKKALQQAVDSVIERNRLIGNGGFINNIVTNNHIIATANENGTIKVWDMHGGLKNTIIDGKKTVRSVDLSNDGKAIVSASEDGNLKLWGNDGIIQHIIPAHNQPIRSVSFSPDNKIIASASKDNTIKLWRIMNTNISLIRIFKDHQAPVNSVAFSPNGQKLASASEDKTIRIWNISNGNLLNVFKDHQAQVNSVAFSPNSNEVASASGDGTVKIWNVSTSKLSRTYRGHKSQVNSVAFSPDGRILASAGADHTIKLWSVYSNQLLHTLEGHVGPVNGVVFSPDGYIVISGSADKTVRLWNNNGKLLLKNNNYKTKNISSKSIKCSNVDYFSENPPNASTVGNGFMACVDNHVVRIYDINRRMVDSIQIDQDQVSTAILSRDAKILAVSDGRNMIKIWKIHNSNNSLNINGGISHELFRTFQGYQKPFIDMRFSYDEKYLIVTNSDGNDQEIEIDPGFKTLMESACGWVKDYLQNSQDIKEESDRHICDDVKRSN